MKGANFGGCEQSAQNRTLSRNKRMVANSTASVYAYFRCKDGCFGVPFALSSLRLTSQAQPALHGWALEANSRPTLHLKKAIHPFKSSISNNFSFSL